jgi:hypothetical protein
VNSSPRGPQGGLRPTDADGDVPCVPPPPEEAPPIETNGWIGHNGSIPGYETVTVYLPSRQATLVIMINTDVVVEGQESSTLLARAIAAVATPGNGYDGSVVTRP